ncbi:hypothetical protein QTP86_034785 [Hemibagrus guttatus]|nr:hypothetical protein QTP86_034785 [Hemibagrus guttatus]
MPPLQRPVDLVVECRDGGLLSGGARPLSLRHGVRCEVSSEVSVEQVLMAVGESVGCENIVSARMNKAVVVFVKDRELVHQLIEDGIRVSGEFYFVTPLTATTIKVTVSNTPPFIPNEDIEWELTRFGKIVSDVKMVSLNCKNPALKHVISFRRTVLMFLNEPTLHYLLQGVV